jgi:branched-chain amino acid transport system substrate-binding protein
LFAATPIFAADVIKVGEIATVTGDFAAFGDAEVKALEIAAEEINAAGGILGKKVEIIMYDCRTRQEDMVNAARRLVEQDKVCAVIGPSGSGLNIAASPIFTKAKVPHIGTMPTNPAVTVDENGNVRPYNFRICFIDPYVGQVVAHLAFRDMGKKKAAILYDVSSDYSHGLRQFFMEEFVNLGGTIVADEGYRADDVDFRSQLTNIKNTDADIFYLPNMGKAPALIMKQAREMGMDIAFIGGDGYGDFWWEIAGDAIAGSYWMSHVAPDDDALQGFFRKYEEKFGTECKEFMNAVTAYDSLYWLKDAIERAGSDDPEKIRDALEQTKDLKLMHATITMDEFHNPKNKDCIVLELKDGKAVFFKRVNAGS